MSDAAELARRDLSDSEPEIVAELRRLSKNRGINGVVLSMEAAHEVVQFVRKSDRSSNMWSGDEKLSPKIFGLRLMVQHD